jgi:PKD repeat protein
MDSIIYEYMKNTKNIETNIGQNKYYLVYRPNPKNKDNGNIFFIYAKKQSRGIYKGYIIYDMYSKNIMPYSHTPEWNSYIAGKDVGLPEDIENANYSIEPKDKIVFLHKAKVTSRLKEMINSGMEDDMGIKTVIFNIITFQKDYEKIINEQDILSKPEPTPTATVVPVTNNKKTGSKSEESKVNKTDPDEIVSYEEENDNNENTMDDDLIEDNEEEVIEYDDNEINIKSLDEDLDSVLDVINSGKTSNIEDTLDRFRRYEVLNFKQVLPFLRERLAQLEREYLLYPHKYRLIVDVIRHLYEEIVYNNYNKLKQTNKLYPSRENPNFQQILETKEELQILKQKFDKDNIIQNMEKSCNHVTFEYQKHQKFISVMMENYDSLLVYHGTGVGKTCSSIMSAELYLDNHPDSKIYVILPKGVQSSFLKQIFNTDDYINGASQCTREKYPMIANLIGETNMRILEKGVKKIVNNRYELRGYQEFSNIYSRKKKQFDRKYMGDSEMIASKMYEWIQSKFENSFIIIDEAHKLRSGNNQEKQIFEVLDHIFRVTNNCKVLAMSATPIYNQPTELSDLISLLRLNEKRSVVSHLRLMNDVEYLKRKTAGYVSYMRSENPIYFAQQVYPSRFNPEAEMKIKPKNNYHGIPIPADLEFNTFELIDTPLDPNHSEVLMMATPDNKYDNKDLTIEEIYDEMDYGLSPNDTGNLLQMSNMVAPKIGEEDELPTLFAKKIFDEHFTKNIRSKKRIEFMKVSQHKQVQFSYKNNSTSKGLFTKENLNKYAEKISKIVGSVVECIQTGEEGLIFIYSRYRFAGVIPIALALEEAGLTKYGGIPLLENPVNKRKLDFRGFYDDEFNEEEHGKFVQAKYIILSGSDQKYPLGRFNNAEIRKSTLPSNIKGEHIKVILGTESIAEGVDFYNIRSLHILEPWYHFNLLKQVIGRGVRFCRHSQLPIEKRNVMIHMYGTRYTIDDGEEYGEDDDDKFNIENETIDMFLFRYGQIKAKEIGLLTRLLKKNSADCNINKEVNVMMNLGDVKNSTLMNGTNINIPIGDQPYSYYCDFMQDCDYECTANESQKVDKKTFNQKTFYYEIDSYIQIMKELMKNNDIVDVRNIRDNNGNLLNPTILTEVLLRMNNNDNYLIERGDLGFTGKPITGKLEIMDKYYAVFRPKKINSTYISMHHRTTNPPIKSRFSTSFYKKNEYIDTPDQRNKKYEKQLELIQNLMRDDLYNWEDNELFRKERYSINNNEFSESNAIIFIKIANILGEYIFIRKNQRDTLIEITKQIILELFIYGQDGENGKDFLEEYTRRAILSKNKEDLPLFNEMSKYLYIRKNKNKIIGYVYSTKLGSNVIFDVYVYNNDDDTFNQNATYRNELERNVLRTIDKFPMMSKVLGSRYISKKGKSGYKFKIIDFRDMDRTVSGIDCTSTGQKNNKIVIMERMDYVNRKMKALDGVDLDPTILLSISGKKSYSESDIIRITNGEALFPKFLMCFYLEIILRYMQRKDENMTHYIHTPFSLIFNETSPFQKYSKIRIEN